MTKRDIRSRCVAKGLLEGKTAVEAVLDAGYAPTTAHSKAWEIVRRPSVQSALTEALEANGITTLKLGKVLAEGLDAKMIVFDPNTGGGTMVDLPAHEIRFKAYDRCVQAYGYIPHKIEMPAPAGKGLTVIFEQSDPKESGPVRGTPESLPDPGNGQDRPAGTRRRVIICKAHESQDNIEDGRG